VRRDKMKKKSQVFIGVIGAGKCSKKIHDLAFEVGAGIAKKGAVLVCGGLGGVMEGAAKGAKENGGLTLGILPDEERGDANPYIDIPIPTGMGEARNLVVIRTSDAVVALPGKYGTLSELAFCLKMDKPVVGLSTWQVAEKMQKAKDPKEAVKLIFQALKRK